MMAGKEGKIVLKTFKVDIELGQGRSTKTRPAPPPPQEQNMAATSSNKKDKKPDDVREILKGINKQVECLQKSKFFDNFKPEKVKVYIDEDNIIFEGSGTKAVNKARDKVKKQYDQIIITDKKLNASLGNLLEKDQVVQYIDDTLDIPRLSVTWQVDTIMADKTLLVFALTEKEATGHVTRIMDCIKEHTVTMKDSDTDWFRDLLKNKGKLVTEKKNDNFVIYTTKDVSEKYFPGDQKVSKKPSESKVYNTRQATNKKASTTTKQDKSSTQRGKSEQDLTDKTTLIGNTSSHPAQPQGKNEENDEKLCPFPDYDGAKGHCEQKYTKETITTEQGILEYLEIFYSDQINKICKKHDVTCDKADQLVLDGDQKGVRFVKQEIERWSKNICRFKGQCFCGKMAVLDGITQGWKDIEKDEKCLINVKRCKKPTLSSGWIVKAETPRMNFLFMDGSVNTLDADVVLCPVNDKLEYIGTNASIFKTGFPQDSMNQSLHGQAGKQYKLGDLVPVNDPQDISCHCMLMVVQRQSTVEITDSMTGKMAESIVTKLGTYGYRTIGLSLEKTDFTESLIGHLWSLRANLTCAVFVYCIGSKDDFENLDRYLIDELKIEKSLSTIAMENVPVQEFKKSAVKITVHKGSILDFDDKVDVIVNSVKTDLDLRNGNVSKLLTQKGGPIIQDECDERYTDGIDVGNIAVSTAGNLKCKKIFHVALYTFWISVGNISIEILKNLIIRCLEEAENRKFSSIAFPALGTGLLGYPPCLVAKAMFEAVEEYGQKDLSHLKNVLFVLFGSDELVQLFQDVESWRKTRKEDIAMMEYDIPPKHAMYVARDLDTRVIVSDRDYYGKLSYKEFRVVFAENPNQALKLEWDLSDGCYATQIKTPQNDDSVTKCFRTIIEMMEEKRFHIADIFFLDQNSSVGLQRQVNTLIQELKHHGSEIDRKNNNRKNKNVIPFINYIKTVRVFVKAGDYTEFVTECVGLNKRSVDSGAIWHITEKTAFLFDAEVVGPKDKAPGILKKVQEDISAIEATMKYSVKIKKSEINKAKKKIEEFKKLGLQIDVDKSWVVMCEGSRSHIHNIKKKLEKLKDTDISFDMTEEDYITFLYITNDDNWRSHVCNYRYEEGKIVFELEKSPDSEMVFSFIQSKIEMFHKMSGVEITPPHKFKDMFPSIQQEVEAIGPGIFCFQSQDEKRIIIKADNYEQVQQAKYMAEVKLGMAQQAGGRKHRKFASHVDFGAGPPVISHSSVPDPAIRDGMTFRSKEGMEIFVYCAGIGNLKVDCLVNAANKDLQHGGGIAYHISKAAGHTLDKECDDYVRDHGSLAVGTCCSTKAGNLPYKYIIHAVGPMWHSYAHDKKQQCMNDLKRTILSALLAASSNGCTSIAMPSISSGIFGVPKDLCAVQYYEAINEYSHQFQKNSSIKEIHFIDKDKGMCSLIQKTFEKEFGKGQKM